jgi:hypothetical protein
VPVRYIVYNEFDKFTYHYAIDYTALLYSMKKVGSGFGYIPGVIFPDPFKQGAHKEMSSVFADQ